MKQHFCLITAIYIYVMSAILHTGVANAAAADEMKQQWYDTHYYPIYEGHEEWHKHDMFATVDLLNPPLDLLVSMSTEELAKLMQVYPLMGQITTYFGPDGKQDYITYFAFIEDNCDIFYELLRREDGITCLLHEYQKHELDVEKLNENVHSSIEIEQMWLAEIFGCQFIRYYAHHFTDNEFSLASQIIEKKRNYILL